MKCARAIITQRLVNGFVTEALAENESSAEKENIHIIHQVRSCVKLAFGR